MKIEDLLSSQECILKFKKWKENILTPINSPGKMYISPKKAVTWSQIESYKRKNLLEDTNDEYKDQFEQISAFNLNPKEMLSNDQE